MKNGEVIFLGGFGNLSVWHDYSEDYIGNYVLYEKRDELRKRAVERRKEADPWRTQRFTRWRSKGLPAVHKLERFAGAGIIICGSNDSGKSLLGKRWQRNGFL